jgi:2-polyprenyl-6-methoxyphenol hydroxylase-like FAD-dependent oxidoreductase
MGKCFDVAIVGYGPVGQTLAVLLGQRGWNVAVIEKQPAPYPLPRAVHFDHEVARILQAAWLGDELPRLTEPADVYDWKNAGGETLLLIGSKEMGVSGWPEANMFAQPDLERALDARARSLKAVEVTRGREVVGLWESHDDVELEIRSPEGERSELSARYVVGCDGANSFVRRHIGVTFTDLGFFFDWLIVDVLPHEARVWDPINGQICDPARPTTVVSGGPGRRRWEFMRLPGETIEELNNEATAWRLLDPWNLTPTNATLERHAVYTFQARWADEWRKGRIFLAGDAAHQMPPFAGQGMCSGIRDAANLAWKLDLVLGGKAADRLLDTYASERIPQVRQLVDFSIGLGKVICVADPAEAAARDAAMIAAAREKGLTPPLPTPAIGPGLLLEGDPLAGHLFVQGNVRTGARVGRFDDVVGRGFTLVSTVGDPAAFLDADLAEFFDSIGGISAYVAPNAPIDDVNRSYERWFADHGVAVALARPDFHVFGTTRRIADAAALVSPLRRALRPHPDPRRLPQEPHDARPLRRGLHKPPGTSERS